ncbi:MAG: T9SS type A sorting domain-containing protein [Ignavibacteria bacterium]|nr:T9SS type A sorting domain-containing protein [Ignavibacteria bacterium]
MKKLLINIFILSFIIQMWIYPNDNLISQFNIVLENPNNLKQLNDPINFYYVKIGDTKIKNFYISNAGTTSYSINKIQFQNGGLGVFFFSTTPKIPIVINPNESINITLTFQPDRVQSFYDTLLIFFNEPFNFIYSIPVEGHSTCLNKLFVIDTSYFVGTPNFTIPVLIKGDSNLGESFPIDLSFYITTNAKVFHIDSIRNGSIVERTSHKTFITYKINISNFTLDSTQKEVCYLIGQLFLSEQDTTMLSFYNPQCNVDGIFFETENGKIGTYGICISNISLVNFDTDFIKINIPNQVISNELEIHFNQNREKQNLVSVKIYNSLGKEIIFLTSKTQTKLTIPTNNLSSGIYKVEIITEYQKYSKLISVIK